MSKLYTFPHLKVSCQGCVSPIYAELDDHKDRLKIINKNINVEEKILSVWISDESTLSEEDTREELRKIVEDWLGEAPVEATLKPPPKKDIYEILPPVRTEIQSSQSPKQNQKHWQQAALGIGLGISFMVLMLLGIPLPHWAHLAMIFGGSLFTLILGWPSFKNAFEGLKPKKKSLNMDFLFCLSSFSAIIVSIFFPIMLIDAALMIFGFRHFGQWLEESLTEKTIKKEKFVDRARNQRYQHEDQIHTLDTLALGSMLRIPRGCCIPLNGRLIQDDAQVSFPLHTGKIEADRVNYGAPLFAGMIVASDFVLMEVTALEKDSYLAHRDNSLQLAQAQKAPIQELTQSIMNWFIPGVILFSTVAALSTLYLGPVGIKAALYMLVCACPCTLGLITSLAVKLGLKKTENTGLQFQSAKGLQAAAQIDMLIFDLNGTLTRNEPEITFCNIPEEYLSIITFMESQSTHPIAKCIANIDCEGQQLNVDSYYEDRYGITATIDGNVYRIGNKKYINPPRESGVSNPGTAQHIIYFTKNGKVEGYFLIEDRLREDKPGELKHMLKSLTQNGLPFRIFTGTDRQTAKHFARQLDIPLKWIKTNCTPENKIEELEKFKTLGFKVAMFGDSGNDVDALAAANLSVVVNSPATDPMSMQEADVTLNSSSMLPVLQIFAVGRQSMRLIKQNLAMSFTYNLLSLGFVACAIFLMPTLLNPAFGAALMAVQSACVLGNAYRVNRKEAKFSQTPTPVGGAPASEPGSDAPKSGLLRYTRNDDNVLKNENVLANTQVPKLEAF